MWVSGSDMQLFLSALVYFVIIYRFIQLGTKTASSWTADGPEGILCCSGYQHLSTEKSLSSHGKHIAQHM